LVVVVCLRNSKGRTGTLICCYLLYSAACRTTQDALDLFARSRSRGKLIRYTADDGTQQETMIYRGVDQASQLRWVHYFGELMDKHPKSFQWLPEVQQVRKKLRCVSRISIDFAHLPLPIREKQQIS